MKDSKIIILTVIVSIIIHSLLIYFIKFKEKDEQKVEERKPIEIEVVPRDIPPLYDEPITDDKETTLEHDREIVESKKPTYNNKKLPGSKKKPSVKPEKEDNLDSNYIPNIYANNKVIESIANAKPAEKPGEDTASYMKFEARYASYFGKFRRRVYQIWQYPQGSRMRGETGVVHVAFSILKSGKIVNIRMLESSGYPELDREVLRVLKSIEGIPLPSSYNLNQLNVSDAYFYYEESKAWRNIR